MKFALIFPHMIAAFAVLAACQSADAGISPTRLEANLGILPIDNYTSLVAYDLFPYSTLCHTGPGTGNTPQACVRQFLANYASQGVTGVRFLFALGDGWYSLDNGVTFYESFSTPFTVGGMGALNTAWGSNLGAFFADVRSAGIYNVTPTSVMAYYWSAYNSSFSQSQTVYDSCIGGYQTLTFYDWLPFGLYSPSGGIVDKMPADSNEYNAYNCSPGNPNFWTWTPYMSLVSEIVSEAVANGVTIEEYEIEEELDLVHYAVWNRLAYDNETWTPVLQDVNSILQPSFGNVATFSTGVDMPDSPGADCGSAYGDSAHFLHATELLASLGGVWIGQPIDAPPPMMRYYLGSMLCGGVSDGSPAPPAAGIVPVVTDIHAVPYYGDPSGDVTSTATNTYDDWDYFLNYRGLTGTLAMIGETSSNNTQSNLCDPSSPTQTTQNVSGYLSSALYSDPAVTTVMRPWANITSSSGSICVTPGTIGYPYGPYAP